MNLSGQLRLSGFETGVLIKFLHNNSNLAGAEIKKKILLIFKDNMIKIIYFWFGMGFGLGWPLVPGIQMYGPFRK